MWKDKRVSVILPTYNERDSIGLVIKDFFATGYVDEVVVVNNNAVPGTDEEVTKTKAVLVHETNQGYGHAIQRGLQETTGDLLIIAEPDGTFFGRDTIKLLAYSEDFDVVFGTRTTREMIWEGANMEWLIRIGNVLVAKLMEFLFNTNFLSDVGCTMRLLSRRAYLKIRDQFTVGGSHFGPELMMLVILNGLRFVEVPVNYGKRVGESSVTGDKVKAFWLGVRMTILIFKYRIKSLLGLKPRQRRPPLYRR
jgi:glycosyltransferase involved in cell wall biosynthesis